MRVTFHMAGVVAFVLAYLLGKLIVSRSPMWAAALSSRSAVRGRWREAFSYGGRVMEATAAVGAFLEAVAVLVLATAW